MFRNPLVRELAIVLVMKLFLVWVLWFAFFSQPAEEVDAGALFANGDSREMAPNRGLSLAHHRHGTVRSETLTGLFLPETSAVAGDCQSISPGRSGQLSG